MVTEASSPGDRVVFVTSSHGSGDGRGSSFLCLLPDIEEGVTSTEVQGYYMDPELASDLGQNGTNQAQNFVFVDACYSGGLIEELLDSLPNVVGTTTCTRKGYGYDDAGTHSGAWTNGFLTCCLARRMFENLDLARIFSDAQAKYTASHPNRGDWPCFFGRSAIRSCVTNTDNPGSRPPPTGVFMSHDWLAPVPVHGK